MISPRGNFITLLKSRRNKSIQRTRQAYLGHKVAEKIKSKYHSSEEKKGKTTKRKQSLNKSHSANRQSTNRLDGQTNRYHSKEKSRKEINVWSKTCISMSKQKQNYDDQRKKNLQGLNCRIVVMNNNKTQNQYFLVVKQIIDLKNFFTKALPQFKALVTVPRQISLQFLLTQPEVSGQFLNGQTVYLKLQGHQGTQKQISLQDFQIIKQIGQGGFSKVFLCKSKIDGSFYAMKLIEKQMVIRNKKKKIVMNQRIIMEKSKHPFLIDLKYAFEAEKYIVFILQYCPGGQLFGLIKKYRRLTEEIARFYIIQIFLGLAYLHSQKVVYRDIKPENILLGIDGHIKIADLGLAKPNMNQGQLAYSFCGSPEYMSPQMIMQVGHTYPVDYYCMGALLYELLTGLPPFYSQEPEEIYEAVLVQQLTFPQDLALTTQCKSLLKSLLCKDPKKRLGSLYGTKQILAHPWFGKQRYENFINKKVQPPFHFKNLDSLNLDTSMQDKNRQSWERVLKDQKYEKKEFKQIMKDFYYNYRPKTEKSESAQSPLYKKILSSRPQLSQRSKQNKNSVRKLQRKDSGVCLTRNPLQKVFYK